MSEGFIVHEPVLLDEVIHMLAPRAGGRYIDGTVGTGGHTEAILMHSSPDGRVLGLDADPTAVESARRRLAGWGERVILVHSSYVSVRSVAEAYRFQPVQGILLDLGWSSVQMADAGRGFSFMQEGPLDMRYDPEGTRTAADAVNGLSERELADILWRYGEERQARRIARAIVRNRPLRTTREVAEIIEKVVGRREKIHPATRTFQALRIWVNDELSILEQTLEQLPDLLAPGGVLAVISFHSLEDRIVKNFLRREAMDCICPPESPICTCGHRASLEILTKKPITPGDEEITRNPRARSARLRGARRLERPA